MLGASFQIGRSALAAYQAALAVSGQNIANLANPDYARQTGRLSALSGGPVLGGVAPGGGVRLGDLRRHVDEAVEARLRLANGQLSANLLISSALGQTEAIYNELTDQDVSTQLSDLLAGFSQLQAAPNEVSQRNLLVASADGLISSFRRQRSGVQQQVMDLNRQAKAAVDRASRITEEIARLNVDIVAAESDGVTVSGALRDRRDALLRELSGYMDVRVREQENGSINVYVGSEPLVQFNRSRGLIVETQLQDGLELARVRFADDRGLVNVSQGSLAGILRARDRYMVEQIQRLDQLAHGLIYEVNRVHSCGVGLVGYDSLQSRYAVQDAFAPLNSAAAGLPFPLENGTLLVKVRDGNSGQVVTRQIEIDLDGLGGDDTTLATLAADLDAVPGIRARVLADNRLQIDAEGGREFWFAEDSSGALAALGVASFFTGTNAADIDIDPNIRADVRRIATSASGSLLDGGIAGLMAGLASPDRTSVLLNNQSIQNFHASSMERLAVQAAAARGDAESADAIHQALLAQRESISGVNLDEEAVNLAQYERAYQGAARYISVLDNLTMELLALVR